MSSFQSTYPSWFQASAAKYMRTAVFCAITQRVVVISHLRFGTNFRSVIQGSTPGGWTRRVVPKRRLEITATGCVIIQKSAVINLLFTCIRNKNQLDATEWFIALIICSTCFGHFYAHHQELETICVLLPPMVCDALVAGCWRSGAEKQAILSGWGMLLYWVEQHPSFRTHSRLPCIWPPTTSNQALHTIGVNNTHIVSSYWWWA